MTFNTDYVCQDAQFCPWDFRFGQCGCLRRGASLRFGPPAYRLLVTAAFGNRAQLSDLAQLEVEIGPNCAGSLEVWSRLSLASDPHCAQGPSLNGSQSASDPTCGSGVEVLMLTQQEPDGFSRG